MEIQRPPFSSDRRVARGDLALLAVAPGRSIGSGRWRPLKRFDIALDDQNLFLLKLLLEPLLEVRQKPARGPNPARQNSVDDNFIAIGHAAEFPETFVGLWEEGQSVEVV
jgi:hypothetical protein